MVNRMINYSEKMGISRDWNLDRLSRNHERRKVPELTAYFWIIKLMTTAMGEATSDYLVFHINHYLAVVLAGISLILALVLQFKVKKYIAWIYWLAVTMVAITGTMAADILHVVLHVPYIDSSSLFAIVLIIVFILWGKSQGSLSIHSITNSRREMFYWATVMSTFALGTAVGDLTATSFSLGYLDSGYLFLGLFVLAGLGYFLFGISEVAAFWFAYILTRPIGASFADYFGVGRPAGLGYGRGSVAAFMSVFIVLLVAYISITKPDIKLQRAKIKRHLAKPFRN